MTTETSIQKQPVTIEASLQEKVLLGGDLKDLKPAERLQYYKSVCESLGLNPLTRPFQYVTLNGRLTLYPSKDCTDQLRSLRDVSVTIVSREVTGHAYVVVARATMPGGRTDESIGAISIEGLKGDAYVNAIMKAETKAKRRVTLSICGLGMTDESELETIPDAKQSNQASEWTSAKVVARFTEKFEGKDLTRDQLETLHEWLEDHRYPFEVNDGDLGTHDAMLDAVAERLESMK